jgi:hypothetical protein
MLLGALGRTDRYSEMRIAGAALAAVDAGRPSWGQALWDNLAASVRLHGVRKVTFVNHRDCGAMHGWAGRNLAHDRAEEERLHADVLRRAAAEVRRRHPELQVELILMDLDGGARIFACEACGPMDPAAPSQAHPPDGGEASEALRILHDPGRFADLLRARGGDARGLDEAGHLAALSEGVTRFGLSAHEARDVAARVLAPEGTPGRAREDLRAFLRSRADRQGRISARDVAVAARFHRAMAPLPTTRAASERDVILVAEQDGLQPRPRGPWPFRSIRWFQRLLRDATRTERGAAHRLRHDEREMS